MAPCRGEGSARMANGDAHEFYISPHRLESGDEWGVLGGLLLKPLVAPEVLTESGFDDDEVALLAVKSARVRRRGVRYSSGVDEVGSGAVPRLEEGLLSLLGWYPVWDAGGSLCAFRVSIRGGLVVSRVL